MRNSSKRILRSNKKMTLRELSEGTGLSFGFLSPTWKEDTPGIATDSLMKNARGP